MTTREQRYEARTAAIAAEHADLRTLVSVSQQAALALKREVERLLAEGARPKPDTTAVTPAGVTNGSGPAQSDEAFTTPLDAYKYVGFEDQFRGSREAIRARLESYVPFFPAEGVILDVGCGRGEFLDLLKERGISGRGIDLNHEMAEVCRARGLDVAEADAVGYLQSLDDGTLGGIFAAQVVEHLQPSYLLRFLELAHHKVRPGGRVVLETLNPACWVAFFESYIRDITHVWPLHPETLKYLVLASGFAKADIEFRSPVAPQDRLQSLVVPAGAETAFADVVETFNANVEKLNARMFTHLDYAIVAER
jgi:O-antigen chain-terminating methyltransferase